MHSALPTPQIRVLDHGLTVLSEGGTKPCLDVVFVHGLGGHPQRTWSTTASLAPASAESVPSKLSVLKDKTSSKIKSLVRKKSPQPGATTTEGSTTSAAVEPETTVPTDGVEASGTTIEDPADQPSMPSRTVFWPRDLLAKDFKNVRILTFGYESDPTGSSQSNLFSLSKNLLVKVGNERLENVRTFLEEKRDHMGKITDWKQPERPIIFICHSLGGIMTKFGLKISEDASGASEHLKAIRQSTRGIFFFGTPHSGASIADLGETIIRIGGVFSTTNSTLLAALNAKNETGELERLREDFDKMLGPWWEGKFGVVNFREKMPLLSKPKTPVAKLIVPLASAHIASQWAESLDIDDDHRGICKFGGPDDPKYHDLKRTMQRYISKIVDEPESDAYGQTMSLKSEQLREERKECLKSLWFNKYKTDPRTKGTFEWIWENPTIVKWYEAKIGAIWIQGKAGSGKSTMMQYLFETEQARAKTENPKTIVAHFSFFSQDADGPQSSMKGLIRSLLEQIIQQRSSLADPILAVWRQQKSQSDGSLATFWTDLAQLKNLLIATMNYGTAQPLFSFYVDGLDECKEYDQPWYKDISFLLESVVAANARICLSSRPTHQMSQVFRDLPTLALETLNNSDIRLFLQNEIKFFKLQGFDFSDFENILERICNNADGLFLWAKLIYQNFIFPQVEIRSAGEYVPLADLETLLNAKHDRLDNIYHAMLQGIPTPSSQHSAYTLELVLCSGRPLDLVEFRYALAFGSKAHDFKSEGDMKRCREFAQNDEYVQAQIKSRCGGLVEIKIHEQGHRTVQFIHHSARDFVSRIRNSHALFDGPVDSGHVYLARACSNWLSSLNLRWLTHFWGRNAPSFFHAYMRGRDMYPFLTYSVTFWLYHVRSAETITTRSQVTFLSNSNAMNLSMYHAVGVPAAMVEGWLDFWKSWTTIRGWRDGRENVRGIPGPLSVAVSCRLIHSATDLLNNEHDPNEAGGFPLQSAAIMQWDEMMILLLQHGAKVTGLARQPYLSPAETIISILRLYITTSNGVFWDGQKDGDRPTKPEAVSIILDKGLDSPTLDERDINNTLTFAAILGDKYLVEMLLLRAQNHHWLEAYVSSALVGMMSFFPLSQNVHLDDIISTLLNPLSSEAKRNALNCVLRLFLKDSAGRNKHGMTVAIAMFQARQALDEDCVEHSSLTTATSLYTAITDKYGLTPHAPDWKPQVSNKTPLYGPGERDLFVPVYKNPTHRNRLLQDGSALFFEREDLSTSEEMPLRTVYHF